MANVYSGLFKSGELDGGETIRQEMQSGPKSRLFHPLLILYIHLRKFAQIGQLW